MKLISFTDEKLVFDDGTTIEYEHSQDCCELVYADFSQLEGTDVLSHNFEEINIEGVRESGFRINGYFIPCYNKQNGYYSNNLYLVIKKTGEPKITIDIRDFVKDEIE